MYCHWRSSYQEGRVGILLNGFNPPHFFACPKTGPGFPTSLSHGLFLFLVSEGERWYWWHCCPSLLFLVRVRGDIGGLTITVVFGEGRWEVILVALLTITVVFGEGERWYWWHCWPSLLFLVSEGERWYWWHCWPSLFILPFLYALHISIDWHIVAILENVYCGNVCVVYIYPLPVSPCY